MKGGGGGEGGGGPGLAKEGKNVSLSSSGNVTISYLSLHPLPEGKASEQEHLQSESI